ncbi:Nse1 non-SMC component of SMC5-6 complex-domain-containing protein [Coprinopsis sp. MPI-PUGE-AT-0042]|nr:Nse1 non-SMC component of SMC5-6 complex-domain-containing protein [Coprinopsis sp. MPI-PUGE-AT-0042]
MEVSNKDVYRLYLQAVLSRGIMSESVAKLLMQKCYKTVKGCNEMLQMDPPSWDTFVTNLNDSIDRLDFEFRLVTDENNGNVFYALVNRKGDEIAQVATDYTPAEIAFFKAVVEQIMSAGNDAFSVGSRAAVREITNLKLNMTQTHGENLLSSFVAKGWLHQSKRGRYSLAARSLLELGPYLKSTYGEEVLECHFCGKILTRGVTCQKDSCEVRVHYHCFERFARAQKQPACPKCRTEWPKDPQENMRLIGEEAAGEGDRPRTRRATTQQDSDEDEATFSAAEDEEEEEESSRSKRTKVKKEKKSKKATFAEESDVDMDEEASQPSTQAPRRSNRRG